MNMSPILPDSSPADVAGVHALVALIADPAASSARLKELQEAADKNLAAKTEAEATANKAASDRGIAETAMKEAQSKSVELALARSTLEGDTAARMSHFATRESDLARREQQLQNERDAFEASSTLTKSHHTKMTVDLDAREDRIKKIEEQLDQATTRLSKERADFDARVAKMRELAG